MQLGKREVSEVFQGKFFGEQLLGSFSEILRLMCFLLVVVKSTSLCLRFSKNGVRCMLKSTALSPASGNGFEGS